MSKARRSGITVNRADVPVILGMINRGDRKHDVAAWFGLNQGRVKEIEDGKHGIPSLAPANTLLPSGSPGPKAQALRELLDEISGLVKARKTQEITKKITDAIKEYERTV